MSDYQLPVATPDTLHSYGSCLMFPVPAEARRKFKALQAEGHLLAPIIREVATCGGGFGYLRPGGRLVAFDAGRLDQALSADYAIGQPWCLMVRDCDDATGTASGPVGYDENSLSWIFQHVTAFAIDGGTSEPKFFEGIAAMLADGQRVMAVQTSTSQYEPWETFLAAHRPGTGFGFARLHQDGEFGISCGIGVLGRKERMGRWQSLLPETVTTLQ